jgi:hypothetical protein
MTCCEEIDDMVDELNIQRRAAGLLAIMIVTIFALLVLFSFNNLAEHRTDHIAPVSSDTRGNHREDLGMPIVSPAFRSIY